MHPTKRLDPPQIDFNKFWIEVDESILRPNLSSRFNLQYLYYYQIPLSVEVLIKSQFGKLIGISKTGFISDPSISLNRFPEYPNGEERSAPIKANCFLSWEELEHIETCREANGLKSVLLFVTVECNYLNYDHQMNHNSYKKVELTNQFEIAHSDWINKFAPKLSLGEFLLVELTIPKFLNQNSDWYEDIKRSIEILERMKQDLVRCDWNDVVEESRKLWELFYANDKKNNIPLQQKRERIRKLFGPSNLSDEGFDALMNSINGMFEFTSKFHHSLDRSLGLNPAPNSKKENAYFIFTSCVNFLKMIIAKLN